MTAWGAFVKDMKKQIRVFNGLCLHLPQDYMVVSSSQDSLSYGWGWSMCCGRDLPDLGCCFWLSDPSAYPSSGFCFPTWHTPDSLGALLPHPGSLHLF